MNGLILCPAPREHERAGTQHSEQEFMLDFNPRVGPHGMTFCSEQPTHLCADVPVTASEVLPGALPNRPLGGGPGKQLQLN